MKREELKNLIKECLVEILSEGINVSPKKRVVDARQSISSQQNSQPTQAKKSNFIEEMMVRKMENGNSVLKEGKTVMSSIFEDTLKNTLPKMSEVDRDFARYKAIEERNSLEEFSGMTAEEIAKKARPEQIFGEDTSNKWSKLAFFEPKLPSK